MGYLENVRKTLNCNLLDFAKLFDTSKMRVSRSEKGYTYLPNSVHILSGFEGARREIIAQNLGPTPTPQEHVDDLIAHIRFRLIKIDFLLEKNKLDLEKCLNKYKDALNAIEYAIRIIPNAIHLTDLDVGRIHTLIDNQRSLSNRYRPLEAHRLRVAIAQLEAERQLNLEELKKLGV
jgi:hypothetical protein